MPSSMSGRIYISLRPVGISHQFIGYEVRNPKIMATCIMNQNSTVSVSSLTPITLRKTMK